MLNSLLQQSSLSVEQNSVTPMLSTVIRVLLLFCSTDREDCCSNEFSIAGNWFLPNGSKVPSTMSTQALHITLGNQTVGLNIKNSAELPTGIYRCKMMDRKNVTHYLYAGIYLENEGMTSC